ncbi:hypothetical protein BDV39DRAFT_200084 [Aspergillus sergii]|uniref:Uncharacterized protein n=1 Tax=Aspergillus sergii TaxID=1034303 RepID=A0A5N6XI84_9EURO|nr:hypothetical protein BDV39DRAFT_200084 [Aspergillus sergii]
MRKWLGRNPSTRFQGLQEVPIPTETKPFDSDPNVFILLAHDPFLFDVLPLFNDPPDRDVNDWQARGYKDQSHWRFLDGFPRNNRPGRRPLVNGLRRNGQLTFYGEDGEFHDCVEITSATDKLGKRGSPAKGMLQYLVYMQLQISL